MTSEKRSRPDSGGFGTPLAVLAGVVGVVVYSTFAPSDADRLRGKPAPDFTLALVANAPTEQGQAGRPTSTELHLADWRGTPVVLDFWASWCGPCRKEAPVLQALSEKYQGRVRFAAVNTSDDRDGAVDGARAFGIRFPVAFDEDRSVAKSFGIESLPTLVVITKEGAVHAVRIGTTSESELAKLIDETL